MGGTYLVKTGQGATPEEALETVRAGFRADGYADEDHYPEDWTEDSPAPWADPFRKGFVQVWEKPVLAVAADWMRGWIAQHPPAGVDPDDKWGPWLTFPLADGGWLFFGWVNT
jgi:hypothetical protein